MADKIQLQAEPRKILGKKVKKLRQEDLVPANVYGSKLKSLALSLKSSEFKNVLKQAGETQIVDLQVKGEKEIRPTLIHNVQTHPVDRQILHVDLRQVNLKEKIKAFIVIELVGESPAQSQGAVIVIVKNELEVEALPTDLPEKFEVDISKLKEIGDSILVKNLKVDTDKVKILAEGEDSLVIAEEPKQEEEPEPQVEAEAVEGEEGEAVEGAEGEEGDKAKEGEADKDQAEAKPEPEAKTKE